AEFQRVLTEARLGRPLEEAFEAMAKRTRSLDFEWTVMAIRLQRQGGGKPAGGGETLSPTIPRSLDFEWRWMATSRQRQVGGNLAEVLNTVSQTIRDRYSLKRQIRALSAE